MVLHRNGLSTFLLISALLGMATVASPIADAATLIVVNNDGPGEGFNDPAVRAPVGGNPGTTLGQQRLIAFQQAADIWGGLLSSPVTIRIGATFDPLSCNATGAVVGQAGPNGVFRDFTGALVPNTWYPGALANAQHGSDLDAGDDDISAQFNSSIGTTCSFPNVFYYGLDSNPPGNQIDFLSVVLHELGHGLGFQTFVDLASGSKLLGMNDVFMLNLEDHGATPADYPSMTNAQRVTASKHTGSLHWVGAHVEAVSGILSAGRVGNHVQMFAPGTQQPGSSVSHWDTALVPNQLLEPIYTGPIHQPALEVALFQDIGWTLPAVIAPNVSLTLTLNRHTITAGQLLQVSASVANSGGAAVQDFYFVIIGPPALSTLIGCPMGDGVVFLFNGFMSASFPCVNTAPPQTFPPLAPNTLIPAALPLISIPNLFSIVWPVGAPPGSYTFSIFATPTGAFSDGVVGPGDITAVAADTVVNSTPLP